MREGAVREGAAPGTAAGMSLGLKLLPVSTAVIVLDQLTKLWIERAFLLYESVRVLPVLDITRLHNTGAAFSFLAGASGWQRWFFTALALVVSGGIVVWLARLREPAQRWLALGLALILGGAIGNVIDRLRLGYVIDFVHVHWARIGFDFPAFNVADSAITVGAGLVLLDALLESRRPKPARRDS